MTEPKVKAPRGRPRKTLPAVSTASTMPMITPPPATPKRLPPAAGRGRKKGETNIITRVIKEAAIAAATEEGADGKGKDGLKGYLRRLARHEPRSFASLLGRIIPVQIGTDPDHPLSIVISADDARIG